MSSEAWTAGVLAEPHAPEWRDAARRALTPVRWSTGRDLGAWLHVKAVEAPPGSIWLWYVEAGQDVVLAAGTGRIFAARPDVLELCTTAVEAGWRNQGLYTAVLGELATLYETIESSVALAPAARAAWRRAGAVETKRDGRPVMRLERRD